VAAEEDPGDEGRLVGPLRHLDVDDVEPPRRRHFRRLALLFAHDGRSEISQWTNQPRWQERERKEEEPASQNACVTAKNEGRVSLSPRCSIWL
jgi:hypothetical protein